MVVFGTVVALLSPCRQYIIPLPYAPGSPPGALFVVAITAVDRRRPAFAVVALSLRQGYCYVNLLAAAPGYTPET